jgi:hypothetical protein
LNVVNFHPRGESNEEENGAWFGDGGWVGCQDDHVGRGSAVD